MRTRDMAIGFGAVVTASLVASSCAILADLNHTYEKDEGAGGGAQGSASSSGIGGGASSGGDGSAGGVGMGGAGGAGVGGAGGAVGYTWTASDPTKGSGGAGGAGGVGGAASSPCAIYAYSLPDWLTFESPTADRSTQISDDSLCVGFNANEPRARNVFPKGMAKWGLSVESTRTNSVLQSDSWNIKVNNLGWNPSPGDPSVDLKLSPNQPDPNVSGPDSAAMFSSTTTPPLTGQHSRYFIVDGRVVSTWVRGEGSPSLSCFNPQNMTLEGCYAHFRHRNAMGAYVNVKSDKWHRISLSHDQSYSEALVLETRDVPAGAGVITPPVNVVAYGAQAEQAAYPSSYISTGDITVTRATEKLYSNDTEKLMPNGYFKVTMKVAPNFAMASDGDEMSVSEYNLLFLEPNNRLFLDGDDRKLYLNIENGEVSSDSLTFDREQELTITVENREGMLLTLTVEGAKEGNGTYMGDPPKPVDTAKTLYILGRDTGAEECSDLRFIRFE